VLVLLAADADEVWIDAAVATLSVVDDQASAALTTSDAALEIVGMLAVLLANQVLGAQQVLDLLPRLRLHQARMLAGVDHAPVAHRPM
jgi:hypothetical protein